MKRVVANFPFTTVLVPIASDGLFAWPTKTYLPPALVDMHEIIRIPENDFFPDPLWIDAVVLLASRLPIFLPG